MRFSKWGVCLGILLEEGSAFFRFRGGRRVSSLIFF